METSQGIQEKAFRHKEKFIALCHLGSNRQKSINQWLSELYYFSRKCNFNRWNTLKAYSVWLLPHRSGGRTQDRTTRNAKKSRKNLAFTTVDLKTKNHTSQSQHSFQDCDRHQQNHTNIVHRATLEAISFYTLQAQIECHSKATRNTYSTQATVTFRLY